MSNPSGCRESATQVQFCSPNYEKQTSTYNCIVKHLVLFGFCLGDVVKKMNAAVPGFYADTNWIFFFFLSFSQIDNSVGVAELVPDSKGL